MWLHIVFTFLLTFTSINAEYIVPEDLPDGVYAISLPNVDSSTSSYNHSSPLIRRMKLGSFDPDLPDDLYPSLSDLPLQARPPIVPPARDNANEKNGAVDDFPLEVNEWNCIFNVKPFHSQEWDQARQSLYAYCDDFLVPKKTKTVFVSKKGRVVAYICNLKRRARVCSRREMMWVEQHWLDLRCGDLQPGWVYEQKYGKVYGRAHVGMPICREWKLGETVWAGNPDLGDFDKTA